MAGGGAPIREPIVDSRTGRLSPVWERYFVLTLTPVLNALLENIPTNFEDGSVPFVEDGFLNEDNANFSWDNVNDVLNILALKLIGLSPGAVTYIDDDNLLSEDTPSLTWNDIDKILSALKIYTDKIMFDLTAGLTPLEGELCWNNDDGTLNLGLPGGSAVLQIGQEVMAPRSKASGSDIDNGQLVYVSGASGSNPKMSLAKADASSTSSGTIAMATEDIAENQPGFFTAFGLVREVNTDPGTYSEGDQLYLSPTIAGGFTNIKPLPPNFIIKIGVVMRAHATEGVVFVTITQRTNNFNHIRGMVAGSIPFADSDGFLDENNPGITYDGTHFHLALDNSKAYFGAGDDMSIFYDGVDANLKTNEVAPSDFLLDCGTDKTLELQDVVWDDQQVNLGTVKKGSSSPNDIDYQEGIALEFVNSQSNEIRFNIQISHKYKIATNIEFHVHTAIQNNTGGNVRWQLKVSYADIMGNFNNTATFLATQIVPPNSQDDHLLVEISDAIAAFSGVSGLLLCNLTRLGSDALDTLSANINVVALDSHIAVDTMGSRQETVK